MSSYSQMCYQIVCACTHTYTLFNFIQSFIQLLFIMCLQLVSIKINVQVHTHKNINTGEMMNLRLNYCSFKDHQVVDIKRSPSFQGRNGFCLKLILQSPKEEGLGVVGQSKKTCTLDFQLEDKVQSDQLHRDAKKGRRVDSVSGYGSTPRSLESDF